MLSTIKRGVKQRGYGSCKWLFWMLKEGEWIVWSLNGSIQKGPFWNFFS